VLVWTISINRGRSSLESDTIGFYDGIDLRLSSESAEKSLMRVVSIRTIGNLKLKRKKKDTKFVILKEFSLNRSPWQRRQKCLLVFVKHTKIL
jgi:hypothetical protein